MMVCTTCGGRRKLACITTVTCMKCGGEGCGKCGNSGQVTCPECNGSGKATCPTCRGSGVIR